MENIQIIIGGKELTFSVKVEHDSGHGAPWAEECGHGPVTDWTTRDKRPGELVLNSDRGSKRYYDFAEACRIAQRDGWNAAPYSDTETKRQRAAKAARADFEWLRAWCDNEWQYVGIIVTLLDDDGNETEISDSLWGVCDSDSDYVAEEARLIADELAHGMGTRWDFVEKSVPAYLN